MQRVKAILLLIGLVSLISCGPEDLFPEQSRGSKDGTYPTSHHSLFTDDFGRPTRTSAQEGDWTKPNKKEQKLVPMDPEGIGLTPEDFD